MCSKICLLVNTLFDFTTKYFLSYSAGGSTITYPLSTTKDEFRVPVSQIQELYRAAEEFSEKVGIPCKCYIIVKFVGKGYVIVEPPAEYDKKYYVIKPNKVLTRRQLLECILSQKIHDIL